MKGFEWISLGFASPLACLWIRKFLNFPHPMIATTYILFYFLLPPILLLFTRALAFFHMFTLLAPGLHHPASAPSLALHFPSFFRTSAPVTLFPSHTLPLSLSSLLLSLHHFSHPLLVHLAPPLLRPAADFTWHLSFLATSSYGSSIHPLSPLPLLSSFVQKTHTPDRSSLPQAACTGHS